MKIDYSLYLVTDRSLMSTGCLQQAVEQAILGGCTMVQLREKKASSLDFFLLAQKVKRITDQYNVPLIINDRVDIALAVEAAGVHVGQSDMPATMVKKLIGRRMLLGVSATSVAEALAAEKDGADYLGVGAIFPTSTKSDAALVTLETLMSIHDAVKLPIVAIGGINMRNIPLLPPAIDGVAVVSGIIAQKNIREAATQMRDLLRKELFTHAT